MNDSRLQLLTTVESVLKALGGGSAAARMFEGGTPQIMSNAIARGRLPPSTFLIFTEELRERGYRAPPELWGIQSGQLG
ncbi:hypothetical protein [Bradyrhizobium sp. S3.7.6]